MEHAVMMKKRVTVDSASLSEAVRKAEAENPGMVATRVYCDETGEGDSVTDHCEGCGAPILSSEKDGAVWADGVRTCAGCTSLEPGERVDGRPHLSVVS